jgi:hypothetical protein
MSNSVPSKYMVELATPDLPIVPGMISRDVRRVQEWCTLAGKATDCDGEFGPATTSAVKAFKLWANTSDQGLPSEVTDVVDEATWSSLVSPLVRATAVLADMGDSFGEAVCRAARLYLTENAREAGGDNRGPWERHFSRGRENQPWCQDFASTCWFDAARSKGLTTLPVELCDDAGLPSSYVPTVAQWFKNAGLWQSGNVQLTIPVGSMFFVKGGDVGYLHVGIVTKDNGAAVETIEGNTNTDGSSNGYEVAARHRNKSSLDFGRSQ